MTAMIMSAAIIGLTRLQQRFGPRGLIATGMTLATVGTLYLAQIRVNSSYAAAILPALIVIGAGLGLVFSTAIANATLGVEPSDSGVASATVNALAAGRRLARRCIALDNRGERDRALPRRRTLEIREVRRGPVGPRCGREIARGFSAGA